EVAQSNRAIAAQRARAHVTDERVVGKLNDRIARLETSLAAERGHLKSIDTEIQRRDGSGTPGSGRRDARGTQRPTGPPIGRKEAPRVDRDHGPDLDM
ncbi:hypothetical protein GS443_12560, partial [Rhodococcus hoagii]|nr:hypothetical protein [Prescottella equi]